MKRKNYVWIVTALALLGCIILYWNHVRGVKTNTEGTNGPALKEGASVTPTMLTFGNTPAGGCIGKGICKTSLVSDTGKGIWVGWTALNTTQVIMYFSLSALKNIQNNQWLNFQSPFTTYPFDFPFSLNDPALKSQLTVPTGAIITTTSPSTFGAAVGDTILDTITFSVSKAVTLNVVFGGTGCDFTQDGICTISAIPPGMPPPPPPQGPIPVAVTFALENDNAGKILMTFSRSKLATARQGAELNAFMTGHYVFNGTFMLDPGMFGPLLLPPGAMINPGSGSGVFMNGDTVTDTITYSIPVHG